MSQSDRERRHLSDGGVVWSGPRVLPWGALAVAALLAAPVLRAGEPEGDTSGSQGIRAAGNEARFRVIERVPSSDEEGDSDAGVPAGAVEMRVSDALRRALRRERWKRASALLDERLGGLDAPLRFLRATIWYRRGEYERAFETFRALRGELPVLADYCAYFAAASARELERHHAAVLEATRVTAASRLHPDALYAMAESLLESGTDSDRERAREVVSAYLSHYHAGAYAAELRMVLAEGDLEGKRWRRSGEVLFRILELHPLSEEAERARELLEKYREKFPESMRKKIENRPRKYRAAYYRALFEGHRSEKLVEDLDDELSKWTPGSRGRCRALYWLGKSHTKLRRHAEAAKWYEKILEDCRGVGPYERKALYLAGKSHWNAGDRARALEIYDRLATEFSEHSFADDALYFSARIYRELDRTEKAAEVLDEQVERYPKGDMADDAHWLRVRRWFESGAYGEVDSYVEEVELAGEPEPGSRGRLTYFLGRAREKIGDAKGARSAYRRVARSHPLGYYSLLAINRLADTDERGGGDLCADAALSICEKLPRGVDGSAFAIRRLPGEVRSSGPYRKGELLLSLGLREWAGDEFERLFRAHDDDSRVLLALADLLDRAGAHSISYHVPDRVEGWRERYPGPGNRRAWQIAYPRAFSRLVDKWAGERDLSRSLVWAIVRKESGYDPRAESWANARGLMQLMWGTARDVARDEGVSGLTKASLLRPGRNIRLGTAYLEELSDRLGDHPALLAGGYNGGHGNVSEWLEGRGELPLDLWVEDIPFGQTRRYVKVALAHYWAYEWLYGEGAVPRVGFELPTGD